MPKLPYKLTITTAISLVVLSGATVLAANAHANAHAQSVPPVAGSPGGPGGYNQPANPGSQGAAHLAAAQLQACQKREQAVNNIMARIVDRGTKQIAVFDKIATETETFAQTHNASVTNYAALTAAVTAAKTKAQTDLASVTSTDSFSCSASNPKATVSAFQSSLKLEISDLQAYKLAVKNLIVAVKTALGGASSSPEPSSSAAPSVSPSPSNSAGGR